MARPKTISDENVLAAALDVLAVKGAEFTLSDLALRIGLSRATLIQRFGDRDAIIQRIAAYEVEATRQWLDSLDVGAGPEDLWPFLEAIVGSMGDGQAFSARVTFAAMEARDSALRALANERYRLVQAAIAARLPDGPEREDTAAHLHSVIAGASMHWITTDGSEGLSAFVLRRLRWTCQHLGLAFTSAPKQNK